MVSGHINIGTSGIVLPGNKSTFPEEFRNASRLNFYSSLFNSLEINSSFYKIPLASTFTKWAKDVSSNFTFTVKLWRGITHAKNLQYSTDDIKRFMDAANNLDTTAGCLLIQLPASITSKFTHEVENILLSIRQLNQANLRPVIEFRHKSWHNDSTYTLLKKYNSCMVIHDMPNSKTPDDYEPEKIAYFRFHGPTGLYTGSYSDDLISQTSTRIKQWKNQGKDIYVYFNNTIGDAFNNARLLQRLVDT